MKSTYLITSLLFTFLSVFIHAQKEIVYIFQTDYSHEHGQAKKTVEIIDTFSLKSFETNFGKLRCLRFSQDELSDELSRLTDSIAKSGVDSILVFQTSRKHRRISFEVYKKHKRSKKYYGKIPESWVFPAYILWVDNGLHKIKRVDELAVYPILTVDYTRHFQLYDFYSRNIDELNSNELLETYIDTIWSKTEGDSTFRLNENVYSYAKRSDFCYTPSAEFFSIQLILGSENFYRKEQFYKFLPISISPDQEIANNLDNYYHNQNTAIYKWMLLLLKETGEVDRGYCNYSSN